MAAETDVRQARPLLVPPLNPARVFLDIRPGTAYYNPTYHDAFSLPLYVKEITSTVC